MGIVTWGDWPWSCGLESLHAVRYRSTDPVHHGADARMADNVLYYGDNLDVLRRKVATGTVDLCYIDPPFNSKRNYNQIYTNVGREDSAQAQAFVDTWTWDDLSIKGRDEILSNAEGRFQPRLVELIKGLHGVL